MSNLMLEMGFKYFRAPSKRQLSIGFGYKRKLSGALLTLGTAYKKKPDNLLLSVGFSYMPLQRKFKGSQAQGIGDYDLVIRIDNELIPMCELAESMSITHGENESYTAEFLLYKVVDRKRPKPFNPYAWYAKPIEIDVVHDRGVIRVYTGIVDELKVSATTGKITVLCSDRRERQINALSHDIIAKIGYTSKSAHGEQFASQAEELAKRLETVPASFEFDATGTPYLTDWREKDEPDWVMNACTIYQREPMVSFARVGDIVNEVTVDLAFNYSRLRQRSLNYFYHSSINPCNAAQYDRVLILRELESAVSQTGWALGGFNFNRPPSNGWVNCSGKMMGWIRDARMESYDENGKLRKRKRSVNTEIISGDFELFKRWEQGVSERYQITLRNSASISRYEKQAETLSFSVSFEQKEDKTVGHWLNDYDPHAEGLRYTATHFYLTNPFVYAHPLGERFYQAATGDWIADLSGDRAEFDATWSVAYHTAYTRLLASHRQNTLDLEVKFLPTLDLRHTHLIEHSHFSGRAKVSHFTHTFNFRTKLGYSAIQYRFFQNAIDAKTLTPLPALQRVKHTFSHYAKNLTLQLQELSEYEDPENRYGMLYRRHVFGQQVNFDAIAFRIKTPEIEEAATDTALSEQQAGFEVGIFNTDLKVSI